MTDCNTINNNGSNTEIKCRIQTKKWQIWVFGKIEEERIGKSLKPEQTIYYQYPEVVVVNCILQRVLYKKFEVSNLSWLFDEITDMWEFEDWDIKQIQGSIIGYAVVFSLAQNSSTIYTDWLFSCVSVFFVHILSCVVFGRGPCILLAIGQGRQPNSVRVAIYGPYNSFNFLISW